MLYFLLITIILDFDKNFPTICPHGIYQPFSSELSTVKCNFIIIIRQVLRQKRFVFLSNPILVGSTDISIFLFFKASNECLRLTNLTIVFLLSPNRWHASMSFLVTLTFTLSRTLITLSSKSLLLTDWGIPCIFMLFCLWY